MFPIFDWDFCEIENANLKTLFCQKVQDPDRVLLCEMVNVWEMEKKEAQKYQLKFYFWMI